MQVQQFLEPLHIQSLLPMQEATLTASRDHEKIILLSATGSGKTIGYLLPVLEKMKRDQKGTRSLVIVPTRELALQIEKVFRKMNTGFTVTCCYGGHKREIEENNLVEAPSLIIGTPGRLADHIRRGNINTSGINQLVLDEFDKMMEFGFEEELSFILQSLPAVSFRLLVSATEAVSLPGFVDVAGHTLNFLSGEAAAGLQLFYLKAGSADKLEPLFQLLCTWGGRS
ncbi:MAG: DEAD/DEAH box helicase [Flavihumibacter sp.]